MNLFENFCFIVCIIISWLLKTICDSFVTLKFHDVYLLMSLLFFLSIPNEQNKSIVTDKPKISCSKAQYIAVLNKPFTISCEVWSNPGSKIEWFGANETVVKDGDGVHLQQEVICLFLAAY